MKKRAEEIRAANPAVADLSSPAKVSTLPFPQALVPLPMDRFRISADGTFEYMGREKFQELHDRWEKAFLQESGVLVINVYGTPG